LKLERQANVDFSVAAKSGGLNKVQGNALVVSAPVKMTRPARQIAPPTVKTKLADAKVEKGWSVAGDANAQTQLKEKIKTQDLKKVPPPTTGGNAAAATGANASVAPSSSLAPGMTPVEKVKKGKAAQQFQAGATVTPAGALTSATAAPGFPEKGKHNKGKAGEQVQPGAATSSIASPGVTTAPSIAPEYGKPGKGRRAEKFGGPPPTGPTAGPEGVTAPEGKRKGFERQNVGPTPGGAASPGENFNQPGGKHNKRVEEPAISPTGPQNTPSGPQGAPYGEGRGKQRTEGVNAPTTGGAQIPAGQPREKKHEGKGKVETPTPAPQ
jgi:hypothetical protein